MSVFSLLPLFLFVQKVWSTVPDDEIRWYKLSLRRTELGLIDAFNYYRSHGIEPILIKGWAAARNYPPDKPRFFGDVDLAVSPDRFDFAESVLSHPEFPRVGVDLHRGLRHLDTVEFETLYSRSLQIDIDGTMIRTLRPEDHLRVLCVHWLTDGGAYKERLWDIYYAVANRPNNFDWNLCLNSVSETRRKWMVTTIRLAEKYLGLDASDLPFADESSQIPDWLTRTLETEWATDVRLRPLHTCLRDRKAFFRQILKRLPPNPIQATIDVEGKFDERSRIPHQLGSIFVRTAPSIKRIFKTTFGKKR